MLDHFILSSASSVSHLLFHAKYCNVPMGASFPQILSSQGNKSLKLITPTGKQSSKVTAEALSSTLFKDSLLFQTLCSPLLRTVHEVHFHHFNVRGLEFASQQ